MGAAGGCAALGDEFALGGVDLTMRGGVVVKNVMPDDDPDETDEAEDHEDSAPAEEAAEPLRNERGEAAGEVRAAEEEALDSSALGERDPVRKRARESGPRPGLAEAKEKPDDDE